MESIGIVANTARETAVACARALLNALERHNLRVVLPADLAERLGHGPGQDEQEVGRSGLVVALGGDGTLLAASRMAAPFGTPVLGVHVGGPGSFGFLTETAPGRAVPALEAVLRGHYRIESRLMVTARVVRHGEEAVCFEGLNDLVIRAQSRMLKLRVSVDGTYIATYAADGIIVATPTGSTAYNLAAGGPLVHPAVETILLTPICPHTLNVRSLLVSADAAIHVVLETGERDVTLLTVDGQLGFQLEPGDEVTFRQSEHRARFVSLDGAGFYEKVQTRLRLGERFSSEPREAQAGITGEG